MAKKQEAWRSRIVGYGESAPDQLLANEKNWRVHPYETQQKPLLGVLHEVGFVQNIMVNKRTSEQWPDGQRNVETVVDGHLRVQLAISEGQPTIPITYVDLTPGEEAEILSTLDPLSALATVDKEQLDLLLRDVQSSDAAIQQMLTNLAAKSGIGVTDPMAEWQGMPEFEQEDVFGAIHTVKVHFASQEDIDAFGALIGQTVTNKTPFIWYPKQERVQLAKMYKAHEP